MRYICEYSVVNPNGTIGNWVSINPKDLDKDVDNVKFNIKRNGGVLYDGEIKLNFSAKGDFYSICNQVFNINTNSKDYIIRFRLTDTLCAPIKTFGWFFEIKQKDVYFDCEQPCSVRISAKYVDAYKAKLKRILPEDGIQSKARRCPFCQNASNFAYYVFVILSIALNILAFIISLIGPNLILSIWERARGCGYSGYATLIVDNIKSIASQLGLAHNTATDNIFGSYTASIFASHWIYNVGDMERYFREPIGVPAVLPDTQRHNLNGWELLTFINKHYNVKIKCESGKLRINQKSFEWSNSPIADLSNYKLCCEGTDIDLPNYANFRHTPDPIDETTSSVLHPDPKGFIIDYSQSNSPQKGYKDYNFDFAQTVFRNDLTDKDRISEPESIPPFSLFGLAIQIATGYNPINDCQNFILHHSYRSGIRILDIDTNSPKNWSTVKYRYVDGSMPVWSYYGSFGYNSFSFIEKVYNESTFCSKELTETYGVANRYNLFMSEDPTNELLYRESPTQRCYVDLNSNCCDLFERLGLYSGDFKLDYLLLKDGVKYILDSIETQSNGIIRLYLYKKLN